MLVFLETGSFLDINQEKAIVYLTQKARKARKYPLPQFISHRKAPYLYNLTQKARKARKYSIRCDLSPTEIAETI